MTWPTRPYASASSTRINQVIADQTGQTLERVNLDTERDYWMSVDEALAYGLVGQVIHTISELK